MKRIVVGSAEGSRVMMETADYNTSEGGNAFAGGMGLPPGTNMNSISTPNMELPLLNGFINYDEVSSNKIYREIYYNDGVAGTAIDMYSTLPFGEFSLSGCSSEQRLRKFVECVETVRLKQLFPVMSVDYMVVGKFIGTLNWDSSRKIFNAILPQSIEFANLKEVPIFGADPVITLSFPPALKEAKKGNFPYINDYLTRFPPTIRKGLDSGQAVPIPPEFLLYLGRQGTSSNFAGISALSRVRPLWLVEKALIRGTLDQSWKRQRAIMHITMGDGEWTPTVEEYRAMASMFQNADASPVASFVVTRDSVSVDEVRRGDDFWKWNDIYDWVASAKLKALGLSDSFLSGDGSYAAVENSVNTTIQNFTNYRDKVTRKVCYEKLFLRVARENNFLRRGRTVLSSEEDDDLNEGVPPYTRIIRGRDGTFSAAITASSGDSFAAEDLAKYEIPAVVWKDTLQPDSARDRIDALSALSEKGVPIPLRTWAAAGGFDLKSIDEQKDADIKIRKSFMPWIKEIASYTQALTANDEGSGGAFASAVMGREYDDRYAVREKDYRGLPMPVSQKRRKQLDETANSWINEAVQKRAEESAWKAKDRYNRAVYSSAVPKKGAVRRAVKRK